MEEKMQTKTDADPDQKVGEKTPPTEKLSEAKSKEGKTFQQTGTEKKG